MDKTDHRNVTFDLETLTLGEAARAERESGLALTAILSTAMGRRTLGLFVHGLRTSERPPRWSELSNLRLLDVSPSRSRAPKDGRSPTSND